MSDSKIRSAARLILCMNSINKSLEHDKDLLDAMLESLMPIEEKLQLLIDEAKDKELFLSSVEAFIDGEEFYF